ncbi:MAG TPA: hypothetical protein PLW93_02760 [Candidatus Absconditabacterales bacterium]|nr:hypothetical protein [Candidatus Absconditabacterales bacterium]HNG97171.1 hypothetical protein [Candidatus Absconditabacterales bacterium]
MTNSSHTHHNKSDILTLDFPSQYLDPRDFHNVVMSTSLEYHHQLRPHLQHLLEFSPSLTYLPLSDTPLDNRFIVLLIELLIDYGAQSLCIIDTNYKTTYLDRTWNNKLFFQSVFGKTLNGLGTMTIPDGMKQHGGELGGFIQTVLCVWQLLTLSKPCSVVQVGRQRPPRKQSTLTLAFRDIDKLMEQCINNHTAILVVGNDALDKNTKTFDGGMIFESLVVTLDRKIKTVSFNSSIGELHLYVG